MKIAIIGAGGVGGYFGGLLANSGVDITFVARGEHFRALRDSGLTVKSVAGEFTIPAIKVVDTIGQLNRPDVVFVASKTYDLENAGRELKSVVGPSTIIIPLQNGIDNDLKIKHLVGEGQVYPGLAYIISTKTAPGLIEQTAGPRTIFFGDRENAGNPRLKELEAVLRGAKIQATCSADINLELWAKFLWVTTFAGLTSICRSPIGIVVNDEEAFSTYVKCLDEGLAVAAAAGLKLEPKMRADIITKSENYRHTGSHAKSSMLVDIENGRRTEIEALNGTIVRLGRKHGVPTPIHETIYSGIRLATLKHNGGQELQ